jgi:hypothetical protein
MTAAYSHTQKGVLQFLILIAAAACLAGALISWESPPSGPLLLAAAAILAVISFAFQTLTIEDGGDRLLVRFGPLALFRKAISYREISPAEKTRSSFLEGWGIHRTRRGWLWNVGGFDCVQLVLEGGKGVFLGTDDPDGLLTFLRNRTGAGDSPVG